MIKNKTMPLEERKEIEDAMKLPLLLDLEGGVYWDFDFDKNQFRVGTACNTGLLVDFAVDYQEGERLDAQLMNLIEDAKEFYHDDEESASC